MILPPPTPPEGFPHLPVPTCHCRQLQYAAAAPKPRNDREVTVREWM